MFSLSEDVFGVVLFVIDWLLDVLVVVLETDIVELLDKVMEAFMAFKVLESIFPVEAKLYFSWKRFNASSVSLPKNQFSLPGLPTPSVAIKVSGSEFKICCRIKTSF